METMVQYLRAVELLEERVPNRAAYPFCLPAVRTLERLPLHPRCTFLVGENGSGKSTLARALERKLFSRGGSPILLDGDTLRAGLNGDLGFSTADRAENIRRLAEVATHLARNGHVAIVAAVSPSRDDRAAARRVADSTFREIYVATPAEVCESRDPKGHYAKARAGVLHGFTGIGNDYQPPETVELTLDTSARSVSATQTSSTCAPPSTCSRATVRTPS